MIDFFLRYVCFIYFCEYIFFFIFIKLIRFFLIKEREKEIGK